MSNLKCALCGDVVYCKDCDKAKKPYKIWTRRKAICNDCYDRLTDKPETQSETGKQKQKKIEVSP